MAVVGGAMMAGVGSAAGAEEKKRGKLHLACNQYPWLVFHQREGKDLNKLLDTGLGEVAASGMDGYELLVTCGGQVCSVGPIESGRIV